MENSLEDTREGFDSSDSDPEFDAIDAAEEEAALYSLVHHCGESLESADNPLGIACVEYPHSSRSKASRWCKISKTIPSENAGLCGSEGKPNECPEYISLEAPIVQHTYSRGGPKKNRNRGAGHINRLWRGHSHELVEDRLSYRQSQAVPSHKQAEETSLKTPETIEFSFLEELKKLRASNSAKSVEAMQSVADSFTCVESSPSKTNNGQNPDVSTMTRVDYSKENSGTTVSATGDNVFVLGIQNRDEIGKEIADPFVRPSQVNHPAKDSDRQESVSGGSQQSVSGSNDIVLCTNSDADSDIIEVEVPSKPPPPVIALDSGDEVDKGAMQGEWSDIIILDSDLEESKEVNDAQPTLLNVTGIQPQNDAHEGVTVVSETTVEVEPMLEVPSKKSVGKKSKKKTERKGKACGVLDRNNIRKRMEKFYTESWGGEKYDHKAVQGKMSDNPQKWQIIHADEFQLNLNPLGRVRCDNCNEPGHIRATCPRQRICCFMCGQSGHRLKECPSAICFRCGQPSLAYDNRCFRCASRPLKCDLCGNQDHLQSLCPTMWRKYHGVTTTEGASSVLPAAVYKPPHELACCMCSKRGHTSSRCPLKGSPWLLNTSPNYYHYRRNSGPPSMGRKNMKRKQRDWHGQTSRQDWNGYRSKKRRTF